MSTLHTLARLFGFGSPAALPDIAPSCRCTVLRWPDGGIWIPESRPVRGTGLFGRTRRDDWRNHALAGAAQIRALARCNSYLERDRDDARRHGFITRDQAEIWAGRPLADCDLERLADCIPHSSVPEAIGAIVEGWNY